MSAPRFPARIDAQGRIVPHAADRLVSRAGREVWVSLHRDPVDKIRSNSANAYLWSVVYAALARATGNDVDGIHEALKRQAVKEGILEPEYILMGKDFLEKDPTTVVESGQFSAYVTWIRHEAQHCRWTGEPLHIPEPNEPPEEA